MLQMPPGPKNYTRLAGCVAAGLLVAIGASACGGGSKSEQERTTGRDPRYPYPAPGETVTWDPVKRATSIPRLMKKYYIVRFDPSTGEGIEDDGEFHASTQEYKDGKLIFDFASGSVGMGSAETHIFSCTRPSDKSDIDPKKVGKPTLTVTDPGATYHEPNGGTIIVPPIADYPDEGADVCKDNKLTRADRIEFRDEIVFVN